MRKRILFFLVSVFFVLLFLLFSNVVRKERFQTLDFDTTVKVQGRIPVTLDPYLSFLSFIGDFEIVGVVLLILLLVVRRWGCLLVPFVFVGVHIVEVFGKVFLDHPSPPVMFLRYHAPLNFPSWYSIPGSSYPSGHSMRAFFIAGLFVFAVSNIKQLGKWPKLFLSFAAFGFAIGMAVSRVSLGEHWTTDVVGGSLLGLSAMFLALVFL